ncbi:ATP-binding protein [Actinomadura harenae]|uniref:ATP-binding protein n=1 Tax=Actinomadura harenae TaxID=2483351 RepID=A0A3M2LNF4_9ACTN|nr:ATP-binding protein [Actinomadura harenae]RMI38892.1 ATP-binding protein [Actinomadura harenae]
MLSEDRPVLQAGQAKVLVLPPDRSCASVARSTVSVLMGELGLPDGLIDDAVVAVSELATNALLYGDGTDAELWVWLRTRHAPSLVLTVFDTGPGPLPHAVHGDLLDVHGKGLAIVAALAETCGARLSRSRLRLVPARGKAVWCAFPLPEGYAVSVPVLTPARVTRWMVLELCRRGLFASHAGDIGGRSVLLVDELRVEITRTELSWRNTNGTKGCHPLPDLQDALEAITKSLTTPEPP